MQLNPVLSLAEKFFGGKGQMHYIRIIMPMT